jgi:hypothetical protein
MDSVIAHLQKVITCQSKASYGFLDPVYDQEEADFLHNRESAAWITFAPEPRANGLPSTTP